MFLRKKLADKHVYYTFIYLKHLNSANDSEIIKPDEHALFKVE